MTANGRATVYIAPVDSDPADADAWTHIGYTTGVQLAEEDDPGFVRAPQPANLLASADRLRLFRPTSCILTRIAIEQHAAAERTRRTLGAPQEFRELIAQLFDVPVELLSPGR